MNTEFETLSNIHGISKKEAKELFNKYSTIDNLKKALLTDSVNIIKLTDVLMLKKYFNIAADSNLYPECMVCHRTIFPLGTGNICSNCHGIHRAVNQII